MLKAYIESFVSRLIDQHPQTAPWLADYTTDLETQILIDKTGLEPGYKTPWDKKPFCWTDPFGHQHRDIRIPYGAFADNPHWRDQDVYAPLDERWQYFGTSGWNWAQRQSHWVGFDFDSVANHDSGLQPDQLEEIKQRALSLQYVTARTSKSGKGIHLLVYLDPRPTTRNHREHAALARYVLDRMSRDCGFDFCSAADCCGLILWHWQEGLKDDGCKHIGC